MKKRLFFFFFRFSRGVAVPLLLFVTLSGVPTDFMAALEWQIFFFIPFSPAKFLVLPNPLGQLFITELGGLSFSTTPICQNFFHYVVLELELFSPALVLSYPGSHLPLLRLARLKS